MLCSTFFLENFQPNHDEYFSPYFRQAHQIYVIPQYSNAQFDYLVPPRPPPSMQHVQPDRTIGGYRIAQTPDQMANPWNPYNRYGRGGQPPSVSFPSEYVPERTNTNWSESVVHPSPLYSRYGYYDAPRNVQTPHRVPFLPPHNVRSSSASPHDLTYRTNGIKTEYGDQPDQRPNGNPVIHILSSEDEEDESGGRRQPMPAPAESNVVENNGIGPALCGNQGCCGCENSTYDTYVPNTNESEEMRGPFEQAGNQDQLMNQSNRLKRSCSTVLNTRMIHNHCPD